ncbi:MAG: glucose/galactose MFS transporter, partial [Bacteroidales bacterium]|nr:glucose/galactose MFS transporter [Bacteroidales bacterium]
TATLALLGIAIRYAPLPDVETEEETEALSNSAQDKNSIFQFPQLILGAIALFFYVGVEVIAGDTIIRYGISQGFMIDTAKAFTSYTLVAMIVGYLAGILLIPKLISQRTALIASALLGIALSIVVVLASPTYSILALALLGLANALVWPAIWPLAIHDLGKFIKTGSAVLIMAIAGGAILPLLWGRISDSISPQMAYIILIPSYFIILYYSVSGYKLRNWR